MIIMKAKEKVMIATLMMMIMKVMILTIRITMMKKMERRVIIMVKIVTMTMIK